jgi:hypothetical protein
VRVPLGPRTTLGIVWPSGPEAVPEGTLREAIEALDVLPPLGPDWLALAAFAAGYYQRSAGELALSVLPPSLRRIDRRGLARTLERQAAAARQGGGAPVRAGPGRRTAGARPWPARRGRRGRRRPRRASRRLPAPWGDGQRQDGGLPARRSRGARARPAGARARARDQPDAAARRPIRRSFPGPDRRRAAQRPRTGSSPGRLAGRASRPRRSRPRHAAGGLRVAAAARAARRRRRARPVVQAAGGRPLFGARPGGLARAARRRAGRAGLGDAVAGKLAPGRGRALSQAGAAGTGRRRTPADLARSSTSAGSLPALAAHRATRSRRRWSPRSKPASPRASRASSS